VKGTENYNVWSCAMLLAIEGRNKIGFIDNSYERSNTDEVLGSQWDRVNVVVMGWILNSISEELFLVLNGIRCFYMQLRSNILSRDPLPDAKGAYVLISSEESCRAVVTSLGARPNNNGNRRIARGLTLVCEDCEFNGHTIDRCFKLIGYPNDFGKKNNSSNTNKSNQNFNRRL
ncbi:ribonuclease H-like domain-containing protein, partial [Tanacetum coccineum]